MLYKLRMVQKGNFMPQAKKQKEPVLNLDEEEYVRRAITAWFRRGGFDIPSQKSSVEEYEGKFYVELHKANRTLAVYRIRNDDMLKRLKRWPKEITIEAAYPWA